MWYLLHTFWLQLLWPDFVQHFLASTRIVSLWITPFLGAIFVPRFTREFGLALRSSSYLCLLQSQSTILGWADVGCTQWMWGDFFCVGKNMGLRWRWREVGWEPGKVRMGYVLGVFPRRMQASPSNLSYDYVISKNLRTPHHFIGCFFLMIDTAMKKGSSCVFHKGIQLLMVI